MKRTIKLIDYENPNGLPITIHSLDAFLGDAKIQVKPHHKIEVIIKIMEVKK